MLRELSTWTAQYPQSNWAATTGSPSNRLVLDIDLPTNGHAADQDGRGWLEAMKQEHGVEWLDTPQVLTPSGGVHLHFAWPQAVPYVKSRNTVNAVAPGVHIKASGGYVAVPPSKVLLPDGVEASYTWRWKESAAPSAVPDWLLPLLLSESDRAAGPALPESEKPGRTVVISPDGRIGRGSRHMSLFYAASGLRSAGATEAEMLEKLWPWNESVLDPPLDPKDFARQVHGAAKYARGRRALIGGR